jgi:hypothetical protein
MEYFTSSNFSNYCNQRLYKIRGEGVPPGAYPFQNVITNPPATIKLPPTRIGTLGD